MINKYAKQSIGTMMRLHKAEELPPKGRFHYHQGVFLSGVYKNYLLSGNEEYFNYIKTYVDAMMDEDGNIFDYNKGQMDDIQPGILLFPLYEKTGDARYKKALDTLIKDMDNYPKTEEGGFFHKEWHPNEMWLDGLYMGGPILAEYGARFDRPDLFDEVATQALLMEEKTKDEKTGLLYHAYDYKRSIFWADKVTGHAPEFWGRSMGWVPVAVLDDLDFIPETHPKYNELCRMVRDLLTAICKFQSAEGRWYQVVDKGDREDNWLENSCSCLYVAGICKAVRKGILGKEFFKNAKRGYEAVINSLKYDGEDLLVGEVCVGTGVGNYEYYVNRPVSTNDLHGVGAFLIMCAEAADMLDIDKCRFFRDRCYGIGQTVWTTLTSITGLILSGKCVIVAGYGVKGKDIAGTARAFGARVTVTEDNPVRVLEAVMDGFDVVTMDEAASYGDIFVTATDAAGVISEKAFMVMKNGAVLCNVDADDAIDITYLEETYIEKENSEDGMTLYELMNGRILRVINAGRSLAGEADELDKEVFALAVKKLAVGCEGDAIEEAREEVARRMLRTLGVRI